MSNRAERREAERQARKLAYQSARNKPPQTPVAATAAPAEPDQSVQAPPIAEPKAPATHQISEAQLAANRANAQLSTGPITEEGRATSSRNALKTALTGRTVLLPTDDLAEYNRHLESAFARHRPATDDEQTLVQSIVDIDWRLQRIVTLESAVYLKGTIEFAEAHKDQPAAHRAALIQAETYLKYEKPLRNLNIQESRLQRQRVKNLAELKRLKDERARLAFAQSQLQPKPAQTQSAQPKTAAAAPNGFEFSNQFNAPSAPVSTSPSASNGLRG